MMKKLFSLLVLGFSFLIGSCFASEGVIEGGVFNPQVYHLGYDDYIDFNVSFDVDFDYYFINPDDYVFDFIEGVYDEDGGYCEFDDNIPIDSTALDLDSNNYTYLVVGEDTNCVYVDIAVSDGQISCDWNDEECLDELTEKLQYFNGTFDYSIEFADDEDDPGDNPGGDNPGGDNPGGDNPGGDNPGNDNPSLNDNPLINSVGNVFVLLGNCISEFIPYIVYIGLGILVACIGFVAIKRLINWVKGKTLDPFK